LLFNRGKHAFHGMAGGSGQEAAPVAAAAGLIAGLTSNRAMTPPEPGRADVITCSGYLPPNSSSCAWSADPRGFGLAVGNN